MPAVVESNREKLQPEAIWNRSGCLEVSRQDQTILQRVITLR
jgi:hypothetical protein